MTRKGRHDGNSMRKHGSLASRSIASLGVCALLLGGLTHCGGCSKGGKGVPDGAATSNANTEADPPLTGPWQATLVARAVGPTLTMMRRDDDGLIVRSGLYVYTVAPNGSTLERIGKPADYAPFLKDDAELGGYEGQLSYYGSEDLDGTTARPSIRIPSGRADGEIFPIGMPHVGDSAVDLMTWTGTAWTKTTGKPNARQDEDEQQPYFEGLPSPDVAADAGRDAGAGGDAGGDAGAELTLHASHALLPHTTRWTYHRRTKNGDLVWLGVNEDVDYSHQQSEAAMVTRPSAPNVAPKVVPLALPGTYAKRRTCTFLPARDDRVYLSCTSESETYERTEQYFRLETGPEPSWKPLELPALVEHESGHIVVDREGGMWRARSGARLARAMPGSTTVDDFELPAAPADLARPFYTSRTETLAVKAARAKADDDGAGHYRRWSSVGVTAAVAPAAATYLQVLIARRSGDVWVLAQERSGSAHVVYRFARTKAKPNAGDAAAPDAANAAPSDAGSAPLMFMNPNPPPVTILRSPADQQTEVHNLRGTQRWVGHCATVFVPFPSSLTKDKATADAKVTEYFEAHRKKLTDVVTRDVKDKKTGKPQQRADAYVLRGTWSEDRPTSGVLFVREYPETSEEHMEATAARVAEIVTDNPASPPEIVCSLPSLDRVVETFAAPFGFEPTYE